MKGIRVVLTGGGGFIGSRLLAALVALGADVTLVGATLGKSATTARLVGDGAARFVLHQPDSRSDDAVRNAMRSADVLVLLGYTFPASVDPEQRRAEEFRLNVTPNLRLVQLAGDALRQVVFASSVSVYGAPERSPVRESDPARPQSAYALAKLACEQALGDTAARRETSLAILRYATVYGPGETVPRAIPNFIRAALGGTSLWVDGDGLDEHDYVYVDDVVAATAAALRLGSNGTYNVGTGTGTSTIELARLVLEIVGSDVEVLHRARRSGELAGTRLVSAIDQARAQLAFAPHWRLREGLVQEVAWFSNEVLPLVTVATR